MYVVYWTENRPEKVARMQEFLSSEMAKALTFMEVKRKEEQESGNVGMIAWVSQNPNSVGKPGVDVTGPDYNWKKRRI